MKLIKLLTFILLVGEATGGYSSDSVPCDRPDIVDISAIASVVPNCLENRRNPISASEMMEIDTQFCECANQNQLLRNNPPTRGTSTTPRPTYQNYANRLFNSISNNAVLQTMSYPADSQTLQSRIASFAGLSQRREFLEASPQLRAEPDLGQLIMSVDQTRDQQCVTFRDYSTQRAIPEDNSFFEDIAAMSSFKEEDWDLEKLQDKYNSGNAQERTRIEARLKFLSRNSMIASLFYLTGSDVASQNKLVLRQLQFFNILKNLSKAPSSTCSETPGACKTEALESGAVERFRNEMGQFMAQPDVAEMLSASTDSSYLLLRGEVSEMNRPLSEITNETDTPEDFFNNQILRDPRFREGCAGASAPATCYEVLAPYCSEFLAMKQRSVAPKNFADVYSALENEEIVHGSLLQDSPGFQEFNNQMCNTQRYNGNGGSKSFFEFRASVCPPGNTQSSCQDNRQLMSRFLAEYPGTSVASGTSRSFSEYLRTTGQGVALAVRDIQAIRPQASSQNFNQIVKVKAGGSLFNGVFKTQTVNVATLKPLSFQPVSGQRKTSPASAVSPAATTSADVAAVQGRESNMDRLRSELSDLRTTIQNRRNQQATRPDIEVPQRTFAERADISPVDDEQTSPAVRREQSQRQDNFPSPSSFQRQQRAQILPTVNPVTPRSPEGNPRAQTSDQPETRSSLGNQGGGSSDVPPPVSSGSGVSGGGSRQPIVEVSPRIGNVGGGGGGGSSSGRSPASVSSPEAPTSFDYRPVIPVTLNEQKLQQALTNPQSLADDQAIMEKVNASSESVVRLGLRIAGGSEDTVVYAIKEGGSVRFSLENPSTRPITRPVLNANEMNIRVPDQTMFSRIQSDPSNLRNYEDIVRAATELPGQVVRMNVISASGENLTVYLDKRRSVPTFSLTEPRSR